MRLRNPKRAIVCSQTTCIHLCGVLGLRLRLGPGRRCTRFPLSKGNLRKVRSTSGVAVVCFALAFFSNRVGQREKRTTLTKRKEETGNKKEVTSP